MTDRPTTATARIGLATCGGTIAANAVGGVTSPRLGADELADAVPELSRYGQVVPRTLMTKASPDVTIADAVGVVRDLRTWVDDAGLDAVVVTHGTDTLEEVAFVLDLLWDRDVPLVVTGAMRNGSLPGADGPANLLAATATAVSPGAREAGVLVVANDEIHAARLVRKAHTSLVSTFRSPTLGPIGLVTEGRASILLRPTSTGADHLPLAAEPEPARVPLLLAGIGDDDLLLRAAVASDPAGLVLVGFGGGHIPAAMATSPALDEALARMPVVLASRAGAGRPLRSTYGGFAGSETELLGRGVISSGLLDGPKARVLLSLCLGSAMEHAAVVDAFSSFHS